MPAEEQGGSDNVASSVLGKCEVNDAKLGGTRGRKLLIETRQQEVGSGIRTGYNHAISAGI